MLIISAKPPLNTSETNPLQGMPKSKIEFYGLEEIVRKLRSANIGYIDIANELNTKYIGEDAPKVSTMAVQRWCTNPKNKVEEFDLRKSEDAAVNAYRELCESLDITNEQIDLLRLCMDSCNKSIKTGEDVFRHMNTIKGLSTELDRYLARKQSLSTAISVMQEKVYSYMAANDIVRETLDIVKGLDLSIYAEVKERMKSNPIITEALKRIQKG